MSTQVILRIQPYGSSFLTLFLRSHVLNVSLTTGLFCRFPHSFLIPSPSLYRSYTWVYFSRELDWVSHETSYLTYCVNSVDLVVDVGRSQSITYGDPSSSTVEGHSDSLRLGQSDPITRRLQTSTYDNRHRE